MALVFRERTRGCEPSARFSLDVSEETRTYVYYHTGEPAPAVGNLNVRAKILEILGLPVYADGSGRLFRKPPLAHPIYHSLFAEDVVVHPPREESYGSDSVAGAGLAVPNIEGHATYTGYEFDITFRQRPYPIFPDSRLSRLSLDFDGETVGERYRLYYYREWMRYAHYIPQSKDSFISASIGSAMPFRASGVAAVNNSPFQAVPDMVLPDMDILFNWYAVPQRYLDSPNSYLIKYKGRINQREFFRWQPASLLYLGVKTLKTYTPPIFEVQDQEDAILEGTFAAEKLVDLQLHFIHTVREASAGPATPPVNPNWLVAGHNLLPHFQTKRFWYASADLPLAANQVPSYFSIPLEILFTDPDSGNLQGI